MDKMNSAEMRQGIKVLIIEQDSFFHEGFVMAINRHCPEMHIINKNFLVTKYIARKYIKRYAPDFILIDDVFLDEERSKADGIFEYLFEKYPQTEIISTFGIDEVRQKRLLRQYGVFHYSGKNNYQAVKSIKSILEMNKQQAEAA